MIPQTDKDKILANYVALDEEKRLDLLKSLRKDWYSNLEQKKGVDQRF